MTVRYTVIASPYFKQSLKRLGVFLSKKYGDNYADSNKAVLKQKISDQLVYQPFIAPISERLINLGVDGYRQWPIDDHNIIYYRVGTDKNQIVLLLVMDSRQDIQKLLYDLMLWGMV